MEPSKVGWFYNELLPKMKRINITATLHFVVFVLSNCSISVEIYSNIIIFGHSVFLTKDPVVLDSSNKKKKKLNTMRVTTFWNSK